MMEVEKTVLKNGVTLYEFHSETRAYTYYVTVKAGVIDLETHQDCPGFIGHGHCKHIDHIKLTDATLLKQPIRPVSKLEEKPLRYQGFSLLR